MAKKRLNKTTPRASDLPKEIQYRLYDTGMKEKGRNKWEVNMNAYCWRDITDIEGLSEGYVAVYKLVEVRKLTATAAQITTHEQVP